MILKKLFRSFFYVRLLIRVFDALNIGVFKTRPHSDHNFLLGQNIYFPKKNQLVNYKDSENLACSNRKISNRIVRNRRFFLFISLEGE